MNPGRRWRSSPETDPWGFWKGDKWYVIGAVIHEVLAGKPHPEPLPIMPSWTPSLWAVLNRVDEVAGRGREAILNWLRGNIELVKADKVPFYARGWLQRVYGLEVEGWPEYPALLNSVYQHLYIHCALLFDLAKTPGPHPERAILPLCEYLLANEYEQQLINQLIGDKLPMLGTQKWVVFVERVGKTLFDWYFVWKVGARGASGKMAFRDQVVYMPYKDKAVTFTDCALETMWLIYREQVACTCAVPEAQDAFRDKAERGTAKLMEMVVRDDNVLPCFGEEEGSESLGLLRSAAALCIAVHSNALRNYVCLEDFQAAAYKYDTLFSACEVEDILPRVRWGDRHLVPFYDGLKRLYAEGLREKLSSGRARLAAGLRPTVLANLERQEADLQSIMSSESFEELGDYQWRVLVFVAGTVRQRQHERAVQLRTEGAMGNPLRDTWTWMDWIQLWKVGIEHVLNLHRGAPTAVREWPPGRQCPTLFQHIGECLYRPWTFALDYPMVSFGRQCDRSGRTL